MFNTTLPGHFCRGLTAVAVLASGQALASGDTLLDIDIKPPLVNFVEGTGATQFDATTGRFSVEAAPVSLVVPPVIPIADASTTPELVDINIQLDSEGHLVGGVPGDDLVVIGSFDVDRDGVIDADGVLLTGEVIDFGHRDSGSPTDMFNFVFEVTGGQMADWYAGQNIGVNMNSESSTFTGGFTEDFSGRAKGVLGGVTPNPSIEICTLVTLNPDGTSDFSDADMFGGDGCDVYPQTVPVGVAGDVDATYRLEVTNIGPEALVDVTVSSPDFGLVNEPVPASCLPLAPGASCTIAVDDPNPAFGNLAQPDVCEKPGMVNKIASTQGTGIDSGIVVGDDDPARVRCTVAPNISLLKEVSLDGGPFLDANTVETGPSGILGSDGEYRLTVTNDGTALLFDVVINDSELGLVNVPLPVNPLPPGQQVVLTQGQLAGLSVDGLCDSHGIHLNTATVEGFAQANTSDGTQSVTAQDIAYVTCESPQIDLRKQISLNGVDFFDADLPEAADVPVGQVGTTDAAYRLIVENVGTEHLTQVVVQDVALGINTVIADLAPSETRVIEQDDLGFGALYQSNRCEGEPGLKPNVASVDAVGVATGAPVSAQDPAYLRCISGPNIELVKKVSLTGGAPYHDANTDGSAPAGIVGDDATFKLVVRNIGDEDLENLTLNDPTLGISNVSIPFLAAGDKRVLKQGDFGFGALFAPGYCTAEGVRTNVASVSATGVLTGSAVNDDDVAKVRCDAPLQCDLAVDKTCSVKPQASDDKLCTDAISATTLRYTGPDMTGATVTFAGKDGGTVVYQGVDLVSGVTMLTRANQNGYTIDAGVGEKLGSKTTITINGVEEIIHTSCSAIYVAGQPAPLDGNTPNPADAEKGDPSPNWSVVNFRQKDETVIAEEPVNQEGANSCEVPFGGGDVNYAYRITNTGTTPVLLRSVLDDAEGELLSGMPNLAPGETLNLTSGPVFVDAPTVSTVNVDAAMVGEPDVVCPATDDVDITVAPAPELSCEDGKPAKLGITYVGGSCADSSNGQGEKKSSCSGDSTGASPVNLTLTDKKGEIYLSQRVASGDTVMLDAAALGKSKLDSETNAIISAGGRVLQEINFHTSCSAPLAVGDQHGGIVVSSFTPEAGGKGKKHKGKKHKGKKHDKHKGKKHDDHKGKKHDKDKHEKHKGKKHDRHKRKKHDKHEHKKHDEHKGKKHGKRKGKKHKGKKHKH